MSEGGNYIAPNSEAIFHGVIDLLAFMFVPSFSLWAILKVNVRNFATSEKDRDVERSAANNGTAEREPGVLE